MKKIENRKYSFLVLELLTLGTVRLTSEIVTALAFNSFKN